MKTAICDDEANTRAYLSSLIRAQPHPCEIVEYASAGDCLADTREIDLLFLDIARMDGTMRCFTLALQTGNPVTDIIVNDKRRQSLDAGICFQADFHYPGAGSYDAFDIGIILQNPLQNALEACEKVPAGQRFITLTGRQRGRFFLIEVKNPFVGEVALGQDGLPLTAKKQDTPMHGIGLSNVRRTALKHMGEMEISLEQQVLALLEGDLSDCKAGLENGWCDESEIAKVEALISRAKARMSQVPQESADDQGGIDAFTMASLM